VILKNTLLYFYECLNSIKLIFSALVAQERDWLDKLEKRLRKSPKSAADAEEISEELDVSLNKNQLSSKISVCVVCLVLEHNCIFFLIQPNEMNASQIYFGKALCV